MSDGFVFLFQQARRAISVTEINNLQLAHGVNVQTHVVESFVGASGVPSLSNRAWPEPGAWSVHHADVNRCAYDCHVRVHGLELILSKPKRCVGKG